jgi:redox-sensitive bicupin YhaK (pirin superfamily)
MSEKLLKTRRVFLATLAGLISAVGLAFLWKGGWRWGSRGRIQVRRGSERGGFNFTWLDTRHTFSFGEYHDERYMGFRSLRVINEDRVSPSQGFPTHPHRDMEILSYVLQGGLQHRDSMGNGSVIRPGEIQKMSAGTGITHSEFNPYTDQVSHFLQIWLLPDRRGVTPNYSQKTIPAQSKKDALCWIASGREERPEHCVKLETDADVFSSELSAGRSLEHELRAGRGAWIQVARGKLRVADHELQAGDGASMEECARIEIRALEDSELLLFDLA